MDPSCINMFCVSEVGKRIILENNFGWEILGMTFCKTYSNTKTVYQIQRDVSRIVAVCGLSKLRLVWNENKGIQGVCFGVCCTLRNLYM